MIVIGDASVFVSVCKQHRFRGETTRPGSGGRPLVLGLIQTLEKNTHTPNENGILALVFGLLVVDSYRVRTRVRARVRARVRVRVRVSR